MLHNFALIWHGNKSGYGGADDTLDDVERIAYLKKYITSTLKAIMLWSNKHLSYVC